MEGRIICDSMSSGCWNVFVYLCRNTAKIVAEAFDTRPNHWWFYAAGLLEWRYVQTAKYRQNSRSSIWLMARSSVIQCHYVVGMYLYISANYRQKNRSSSWWMAKSSVILCQEWLEYICTLVPITVKRIAAAFDEWQNHRWFFPAHDESLCSLIKHKSVELPNQTKTTQIHVYKLRCFSLFRIG